MVTAGAVIWCRLDDLWGHGGFCQPCINGTTSGEFPIFLVLRKTHRLIEYYKKSRLCCTTINFKNSFGICFLLLPQNFEYSHFLIFCYINKLNDNPPKQWFQLGKKKWDTPSLGRPHASFGLRRDHGIAPWRNLRWRTGCYGKVLRIQGPNINFLRTLCLLYWYHHLSPPKKKLERVETCRNQVGPSIFDPAHLRFDDLPEATCMMLFASVAPKHRTRIIEIPDWVVGPCSL